MLKGFTLKRKVYIVVKSFYRTYSMADERRMQMQDVVFQWDVLTGYWYGVLASWNIKVS